MLQRHRKASATRSGKVTTAPTGRRIEAGKRDSIHHHLLEVTFETATVLEVTSYAQSPY